MDKDQLFFDERDIMDISLDVLRKDIGYVPQDQFLFQEQLLAIFHLGKWTRVKKKYQKQRVLQK